METPRAEDLPDGSVVADNAVTCIKTHPSHWAQWRASNGGHYSNANVQEMLDAGAEVLRVGWMKG